MSECVCISLLPIAIVKQAMDCQHRTNYTSYLPVRSLPCSCSISFHRSVYLSLSVYAEATTTAATMTFRHICCICVYSLALRIVYTHTIHQILFRYFAVSMCVCANAPECQHFGISLFSLQQTP